MTIEEAIMQLKVWSKGSEEEVPQGVKDAIKLGIAALEQTMELRNMSCSIENFVSWPLRNETIMKGGDANGKRPSGESPQKR